MVIHNKEIAEKLARLADLLEIRDDNPFRIRAYRNAARLIINSSRNFSEMVKKGQDLTELPGIGAAIAEKIKIIVETGELPALLEEERHIPGQISEIMQLPGLGPKKVKALYEQLNIKDFKSLKLAAQTHKIRELRGFSDKTEEAILRALKSQQAYRKRWRLKDVRPIAAQLLEYLEKIPGVKKVEIAGSFRRRMETVADLDILVSAKKSSKVIERFIQFDEVRGIFSKGITRSSVLLRSGLQVDLRVVPEISFGAALLYFTGSKPHNITLRAMAVKRKLKINEYGVFKNKRRIAGRTEAEVYRVMQLPYIEPELRENRGEIQAAQNGKLPKLIKLKDMKGDLHSHTDATDGRDSIEEMAKAAMAKNYEYIAITDHTQHLAMVHGQDEKRLLQQIREIDRLNAKFTSIRILKSAEVDILEDGRLDIADEVLKELDLTVCSIHYKFALPEKKQTERILRAMDNPYFKILGHPTGRLLNRRDPYPIDLERILQAAKERGCFLEINAQPWRLDLNAEQCQLAKEMQLKFAISTDAHSISQFDFMQYGIDQARRGWIEAKEVLNTYPLHRLLKLLKR